MAFSLDEAVWLFSSHVQSEIDKASKGVKNEDDAIARRYAKLKLLLEGSTRPVESYGPKDYMEISETPTEPPPGTYQDPAVVFERMKRMREERSGV